MTLSPIPTMDQASMFKALDEGFTTLNAKAAISTNAVNKYIDFYKNSKVQGMCNTVIFVLFIFKPKKKVNLFNIFKRRLHCRLLALLSQQKSLLRSILASRILLLKQFGAK